MNATRMASLLPLFQRFLYHVPWPREAPRRKEGVKIGLKGLKDPKDVKDPKDAKDGPGIGASSSL
jgi:hypothetical protein